jgi:uncharacterized protein YheU (UPF0270 family)
MSNRPKVSSPEPRWVEVPRHALTQDALAGVVDEYVTRQGRADGDRESSLHERRASALRLLDLGEVIIAYEPKSRSTTLKNRRIVTR